MSYNQMHTKQFVKAKPLHEVKEKGASTSFTKDPKRNSKKYQEKSFQQNKDPRDHIKLLLGQFKVQEKNPNVAAICQKFSKLFVDLPLKPEPENQSSLTQFVILGTKKQIPNKVTKQLSSDSSDPNWDSDEEKEVKLVSKKIDGIVIEKINASKKEAPKKLNDLQRHEKQFLEDYYRQKRQQQLQNAEEYSKNEKTEGGKNQKQIKAGAEQKENDSLIKGASVEKVEKKQDDEWAEYDPNVGALITRGFIQKVQKGEQQDFEMDEDFSYQSEKSEKQSSSDDDDMFADQGPRAITKTKTDSKKGEQKNQSGKQIVNVTSHLFTQIAEQVGALPQSCLWIISGKQARYKVSTQYMNEYYKSLNSFFPFISLNHSEFVHCDEIQSEKGLQKLKKSSQKRRSGTGFNKSRNPVVRPQVAHYKQKK